MGSVMRIEAADYRNIVVLSGAGISVASGIRPYRGPGGLWNDATFIKYADHDTFVEDPLAVWRFWWKTREAVLGARPNRAHEVLVTLEAGRPAGARFTLVTQNIDGLHRAAGTSSLVEYHGNVLYTRCSDDRCRLEPYLDPVSEGEAVPLCPHCGAPLRPHIVMFGEAIPEDSRRAVDSALRGCDLFVAVGTSGTVYPANQFVSWARAEGARTIIVNLESIRGEGAIGDFEEEYLGRAEEILPLLFAGL